MEYFHQIHPSSLCPLALSPLTSSHPQTDPMLFMSFIFIKLHINQLKWMHKTPTDRQEALHQVLWGWTYRSGNMESLNSHSPVRICSLCRSFPDGNVQEGFWERRQNDIKCSAWVDIYHCHWCSSCSFFLLECEYDTWEWVGLLVLRMEVPQGLEN